MQTKQTVFLALLNIVIGGFWAQSVGATFQWNQTLIGNCLLAGYALTPSQVLAGPDIATMVNDLTDHYIKNAGIGTAPTWLPVAATNVTA